MLLSLARLTMRGPWVAPGVIAACGLLALPFGPALFVSGGLVALVTLRQGAGPGLRVTVGALALMAAALLGLGQMPGVALASIAGMWLVVWQACLLLRARGAQGEALTLTAIAAAVYAAVMRMSVDDVDEFWSSRLGALSESIEAQGGTFLTAAQVELYGGMMHEASVIMLALMLGTMVLLGRYWQAGLYNPGGFRQEFTSVVMPGAALAAGAVVALGNVLVRLGGATPGLSADFMWLVLVTFAWQGLAVVHGRLMAGRSRVWGWVFYTVLGLFPLPALMLLAGLGVSDRFRDYRRLRDKRTQWQKDSTSQD